MKSEEIIRIKNCNTNIVRIYWKMTEWCNYNCPYCITGKHGMPFIPEHIIVERAKRMNILMEKIGKPVELHLVGGEVTYYDLVKVFSYIDSKHFVKLQIITNFSRDVSYFMDIYKYCHERHIKCWMGCSYHIAQNKDYVEKLSELTKWCIANKYPKPACMLVFNDDNFDKSIITNLYKHGITRITLSKERDLNNKSYEFSEENEKYFRNFLKERKDGGFLCYDNTGKLHRYPTANGLINFLEDGGFKPRDYICSSGITCLQVNPDGGLCRGGCKFLQTQIIGNIMDNYELPTDKIRCELAEGLYCALCWHVEIDKERSNKNDM